MEEVLRATGERGTAPLDASGVHALHADFVWLTLQRFGVAAPDLEDTFQEVFIVVQRQLHTFDGSSLMTSWLFSICRRVASAYRRRAHRRYEQLVEAVPEPLTDPGESPEDAVAAREAGAELAAILDSMDLDRRATFVMFEIDGLGCDEIAAVSGVPVGTVYSRLHTARKEFEKLVERRRARSGRAR